ncbi:MAG: hypothetical protein NC489_22535 [Ruminococcus flavefaciens]|nr:hypothetical protein [Ruminococcus flavefaciens]
MEQKNLRSTNIKTKSWIWLLIGSASLSACGCKNSDQRPENPPIIQIEEKGTKDSKVTIEEIAKTKSGEKDNAGNFLSYQKSEYDKYGEQYSRIETEDGKFAITLYDKENNVVYTEAWSMLPWVAEVTDDILQIGITGGSVSAIIFYYDKERAIVSPFYTESFYLGDNYVAYMEDEGTLILTDIFEEGELYKKINRNFSDSRHLGGMRISIKNVTMITLNGQDIVVLEYYEGEERELITEIILLNGEEIVFNKLDEIEKDYEILKYDICSPVLYDFEDVNPIIKRYIEYEISNNEEISQKYGKDLKIEMDYHTFDFDDDGLDDYLVCIDRELHDGRVEHWIAIYITRQEKGWIGREREMVDEMAYKRLELNLPLYDRTDESGHKQVMILKEQIDGYYTIVLPESNLILRYNDQNGQYEFCDQ